MQQHLFNSMEFLIGHRYANDPMPYLTIESESTKMNTNVSHVNIYTLELTDKAAVQTYCTAFLITLQRNAHLITLYSQFNYTVQPSPESHHGSSPSIFQLKLWCTNNCTV